MAYVTGNLSTEQRLEWLREVLKKNTVVQIQAAAQELDVSEMTIRRDLQELELLGVARRVRGGAVATAPVGFAERSPVRAAAKNRIGEKLLALVPDSGAIAVDASTTVLRLVGRLGHRRDLLVVTNGPDAFGALQGLSGVRPVMTGGELDRRTGSLVGSIACRSAAQLLVGRFITSAFGVDPDRGASETCLEESDVKLAFARAATEVVLAVDSSKLGVPGVAVSLDWASIKTLVTELDPKDSRLEPYQGLAEIL